MVGGASVHISKHSLFRLKITVSCPPCMCPSILVCVCFVRGGVWCVVSVGVCVLVCAVVYVLRVCGMCVLCVVCCGGVGAGVGVQCVVRCVRGVCVCWVVCCVCGVVCGAALARGRTPRV